MRILLATTSGSGHFGPLLPFAAAFRRAGHEIQVAAPRSFGAAVARAGYDYWPCDDIADADYAAVRAEILRAPPEQMNALTAKIGADLAPRAILPGMLAAIDSWRPDAILREVGESGSLIAAELRSIPQVQVLIGLTRFTVELNPVVAPMLSAIRTDFGLSPDESGERLLAVPTASLLPPSFEDADQGMAVHRYRPAIPGPAKPAAGDPLLYVTFGTVSGGIPFAAEAFRRVVEVLAKLPVRLLVAIGTDADPAEWTSLPDNVRVEQWVSQDEVLSSVAAIVCHGGMGTVLSALTAGVPLVVVPQFADQPDNAARIEALGAGLRVGIDGQTTPLEPDALIGAVQRVLDDDGYRAGAARVAKEIAALPPVEAALALFG
ncbi:MAG TPA: glycosyltransferase [Pseudonocardiaceae bacterium]|jgi:UDP:flavonoid glycosyltransferase YjiC (YdhE family)|nr:glycosyltransferase [Pseudonocardiaceae bacterium]